MDAPLSVDIIRYALDLFFTDPSIIKTRFFKMGAENTTVLHI